MVADSRRRQKSHATACPRPASLSRGARRLVVHLIVVASVVDKARLCRRSATWLRRGGARLLVGEAGPGRRGGMSARAKYKKGGERATSALLTGSWCRGRGSAAACAQSSRIFYEKRKKGGVSEWSATC